MSLNSKLDAGAEVTKLDAGAEVTKSGASAVEAAGTAVPCHSAKLAAHIAAFGRKANAETTVDGGVAADTEAYLTVPTVPTHTQKLAQELAAQKKERKKKRGSGRERHRTTKIKKKERNRDEKGERGR